MEPVRDQLNVDKLKMFHTDLNNLNSYLEKLDAYKLKSVKVVKKVVKRCCIRN